MTAERAPKEAKETNTRQRETQIQDKPFQFEASLPLRLDPANILHLQRTIGNQAVQRLVVAQNPPQTVASTAQKTVIQRWGESEHKFFGDEGSGGRQYDFADNGGITEAKAPATRQNVPFQLTHGDINMLVDWFEVQDTIAVDKDGNKKPAGSPLQDGDKEVPNPDSLFVLAKIPSDDPGKKPFTRDEIIYSIYKNFPQDPRFSSKCTPEQPNGGIWANLASSDGLFSDAFSKEVKDRVESRYLRLAAGNKEHFPSPGLTQAEAKAGAQAPAGDSYRALHEDALWRAFEAGQAGRDIGEALVREAAAQHFLTDYFSAGHIRTPIVAVRSYWDLKYPLFFGNLKKKIALDIARYVNEHETMRGIATVSVGYDVALQTVEDMAGDVSMGFGDIIGRVAHDIDNVEGLWVVNDLGERWYTFGDSHLHERDHRGNRTPEMGKLAVSLGNADIENAYHLGSVSPGVLAREQVFSAVKAQPASPAVPGDKYAPEQVVPRVDPDAETSTQNWQADSIDDLWTLPVRSSSDGTEGITYGEAIKDNLDHGVFGSQLTSLAENIKNKDDREAFEKGFLRSVKDAPLETVKASLKSIIDFNPSEGQAWQNEDDAVMEEIVGMDPLAFWAWYRDVRPRAGMTDEQLRGMTVKQRADRVSALVNGTFSVVTEDEGEVVIRLFKTADAAVRPEIYHQVEGHPWTGDWIQGWLTSDDEIYNGLTDSQLARLRDLINESGKTKQPDPSPGPYPIDNPPEPVPPMPALPDRLYFRFDRPQGEVSLEEVVRSDQDLMPLRELALWTQRVKGAEIALEGHASSEGPEYLNHNLGLARASLIELFLLENGADLDNNRVTTDTRGEEGAEAKPDWRYVQISVRGTPTATQQPNGSTGQ